MSGSLSAIMYHYVRPASEIADCKIPGLSLENFVSQLAYLKQNYSIIDPFDFARGTIPETEKPPALLTFDDAYIDHYKYALPAMLDAGVSGIFFVPAGVIVENRLLDVNKIHYLLAAEQDRQKIIKSIHQHITESDLELLEISEYLRLYHAGEAFKPGTRSFDDKDTTYIKRILQMGLPSPFRSEVLDKLFLEFVPASEKELAGTTYCSPDQLRALTENGMMLGGHGYHHNWLGFSSTQEQREELRKSRAFLDNYGDVETLNCFAYPYGSFQDSSFPILTEFGFDYAFTTMKGNNQGGYKNLEIQRLDTNDIPISPG